jgi:hypothetical protein
MIVAKSVSYVLCAKGQIYNPTAKLGERKFVHQREKWKIN